MPSRYEASSATAKAFTGIETLIGPAAASFESPLYVADNVSVATVKPVTLVDAVPAGSAAALINRNPAPVETYNDLDGEVCTFFRVLREESEKLIKAIGLTPFSREEFALACKLDPKCKPLERPGVFTSALVKSGRD